MCDIELLFSHDNQNKVNEVKSFILDNDQIDTISNASTEKLKNSNQKSKNENEIVALVKSLVYVQTRYNPEHSNPEQAIIETALKCDPDFNDHLKVVSNWIEKIRKRIKRALDNHKIFVVCGNYRSVRKALEKRGWIQKPPIQFRNEDCSFLPDHILEKVDWHAIRRLLPKPEENENPITYFLKYRSTVTAILLRNTDPDFFWDFGLKKPIPKNSMLNRIAHSSFTSKAGLCESLEQMQWFSQSGMSNVQFPRCYTTKTYDSIQDFVDDYRLTACMSLLKQVVYLYEICSIKNLDSATGSIPLSSIQFAIDACKNYVHIKNHEDIDEPAESALNQTEWDSFLRHQYLVVHKGETFIKQHDINIDDLISSAKLNLEQMSLLWPQYKIDGRLNLWVIKPGNSSRGWGIKIVDSYHNFSSIIGQVPTKLNYVFQKYVESPLLIYNTKFDIRQWFLVTSAHPLIIWMYRECYIRFSTQNFNLKNYHESIHLTNFAIQKKYKNGPRDSSLPRENMWDFTTFKKYLKDTGYGHMWDLVIFPGMKQAIVATMLANQENLDDRQNCFQLYGADFILGDDFTPWLLEINSCPDMSHSTTVTSKLCPECFEDLIKVVVDYPKNPMTDTGEFQLIYRQEELSCVEHFGLSLVVFGDKMIIYSKPPSSAGTSADNYYSAVINLRDHIEVPSTLPVEDDCAIIGWDSNPNPNEVSSSNDCGIQLLQRHDLIKNRLINLRPSKASCNLTVRREIQSTFASRMKEQRKIINLQAAEFSKKIKILFLNSNPLCPKSANYCWENVNSIIRSNSTISEKSSIFNVSSSTKKGKDMKLSEAINVTDKIAGDKIAVESKPKVVGNKLPTKKRHNSKSPVKIKKPKVTKNVTTNTETKDAKNIFYEKYVKPATENHRKLKLCSYTINAMYEESKRRQVSPQALRQELNFKSKLRSSTKNDSEEKLKKQNDLSKRQYLKPERIAQLQLFVTSAIKDRKIYALHGKVYNPIREVLNDRGWFAIPYDPDEPIIFNYDVLRRFSTITYKPTLDLESIYKLLPIKKIWEPTEDYIKQCERLIILKLLKNAEINFCWNLKDLKELNPDIKQNITHHTVLNRFPRTLFTCKDGLCDILRDLPWYTIPAVSYTRYPRTYNTANPDQLIDFIYDYRINACISLLKFFQNAIEDEGNSGLQSPDGMIPYSAIQFAINRCDEYIMKVEHEDIDSPLSEPEANAWEAFTNHYYDLVYHKKKLQSKNELYIHALQQKITSVLEKLAEIWPGYHLAGVNNIWIIKPTNRCCGTGIRLMNSFTEMLPLLYPNPINKYQYIIQKYIERPLLIHDTKFDIRQWFLVTSIEPLVIYIYKECYLRFCNRRFTLEDFHESIHLTNNTVQRKYTTLPESQEIPKNKMWFLKNFKNYLISHGEFDKWETVIYPGMKAAIIGVMLSSQNYVRHRNNSFQLYGADFMLDENYQPWLIEINSAPQMSSTTTVTSQLCPELLQDVVKVVLDRRDYPLADIGEFELLYRQVYTPVFARNISFMVTGKKMVRSKKSKINSRSSTSNFGSITSSFTISNSLAESFETTESNETTETVPVVLTAANRNDTRTRVFLLHKSKRVMFTKITKTLPRDVQNLVFRLFSPTIHYKDIPLPIQKSGRVSSRYRDIKSRNDKQKKLKDKESIDLLRKHLYKLKTVQILYKYELSSTPSHPETTNSITELLE